MKKHHLLLSFADRDNRTARNLWVMFVDQLSISTHISMTPLCRFALYNIRKIRLFLLELAVQLLVQAFVISRLDYSNFLLAGHPASATKTQQMIQNAAAHLVFNQPKRTHVTLILISLHWLPVKARIKFKVVMLDLQDCHWKSTSLPQVTPTSTVYAPSPQPAQLRS